MSRTCEICGKVLKNAHGLAIHKGKMHKSETIDDLRAEVTAAKAEIKELRALVMSFLGNAPQIAPKHRNRVKPAEIKKFAPKVPDGFINELKDAVGRFYVE